MEIVLGSILLVLVLYAIRLYNNLVDYYQSVKQAFSDIDVELNRRGDLVPRLVNSVKAYAKHESEIFDNISRLRAQAKESGDNINKRVECEMELGNSLMKLMAVAEAYPNLRASENFLALQKELSDIEENISASRRFFNNSTAEYNTAVMQFPSNLIARLSGFEKGKFFTLPENKAEEYRIPPEVNF